MSIPSDMEWDRTDPLQDGYWKAGLNRYSLTHVRQPYAKKTDVEGKTTTFTMSKEGKRNDFAALLPAEAGGKGNAVVIKEVVPGWAEYQQRITVARSAKGLLFHFVVFCICVIAIC